MTLEEATAKCKAYDQLHVLQYYDTLREEEQASLLAQIARTDFSVLSNISHRGKSAVRGVFSPLPAMEIDEITARRKECKAAGMEALKKGKVALCLLAGGMGTRLGSDDPKGMYDIGLTHPVYIFERLIENLKEVTNEANVFPLLFIMTSELNRAKTERFLTEKAFFGYPKERVIFFDQDMAPACDYEGKVFMESTSKIATSPNGNAGWFSSMQRAGLTARLHEEGCEWVNIFSVDNVLQRIADPVFIGATILAGAESGSKVVRKVAPDEKVGVMCAEDGHPSIVEYYELSDEMRDAVNEKGDPAYNFGVILNYLFNIEALERIAKKELPLHVVEKKITHIDENGNVVKPDDVNGCKFEQLVLDMIHELSSCLPFEVVREDEFAPVKNKEGNDSVDTARALLKRAGIPL